MKNYTLALQCLMAFSFTIAATMSFAEGESDELSPAQMHYDAKCLKASGTDDDMACWDWTAEEINEDGEIIGGAKQNLYIWKNDKVSVVHRRLPFLSGISSTDNCQNKLFSQGGNKPRRFRRSKGWRVFHREFGTPIVAEEKPHFSLYNIYSGEYMFFIYIFKNILKEGYSHGQLKVELDNGRHIFSHNPLPPLNTLLEESTLSKVGGIGEESWFCTNFLFDGYDPITRARDNATKLDWKLLGVNVTEMATEAEFTTGEDGHKTVEATTFTDDPVKAFGAAYKQYKSVDDNIKAAKKWVDKHALSRKKGDNDEHIKKRSNGIETNVWDDVGGFLDSSVVPYLPLVASIAEFVFWSSESPETPVMALTGGFKLTGTLTEKDKILDDGFSLPMTGKETAFGTNVLYKKRLGTFNVWNKPTVEYVVKEHYEPCTFAGIGGIGKGLHTHVIDSIYYRLTGNPLQYVVNPDPGVYVKEMKSGLSMRVDKQYVGKKKAVFYPLDTIHNYWQKTEPLNKTKSCSHFTKRNVDNDKLDKNRWKNYLGIPTELRVHLTISPVNNPSHETIVVRTIQLDSIENKISPLTNVPNSLEDYLRKNHMGDHGMTLAQKNAQDAMVHQLRAKQIVDHSVTLTQKIDRNEIVAPMITIPNGIDFSKLPKPDKLVHLQGTNSVKVTGGHISVEKGQTIKLSIPDPAGDAYMCTDCRGDD